MRVGLLPLARSTFDVPFAEATLAKMLGALAQTGDELVGPQSLLVDAESARLALDEFVDQNIDALLILQVTFTDAAFVIEAAARIAVPLAIWAPSEPRLGGRLRLNAFCGLNLASHALGRKDVRFSYLYAAPDTPTIAVALRQLLDGERAVMPLAGAKSRRGGALPPELQKLRIGRIGEHPVGFDTCAYDSAALKELLHTEVEELELQELFARANALPANRLAALRNDVADQLENLSELKSDEVDRSLRLAGALHALRLEGTYDAFAIRCWPEAFTEYGGAVCGPASILGSSGVPCACEADVYGAVTQAILRKVADTDVFLVDLVDLDANDNSGVVWHCGQAPISMADPKTKPQGTVHSNRKMALLYEFPLKPGRVTAFRLSQARGQHKIVVAGGEVLERPMAFTGTSGVVRFDEAAEDVLRDIMDSGLEHHIALAYGDCVEELVGIAEVLDLAIVRLGEGHG